MLALQQSLQMHCERHLTMINPVVSRPLKMRFCAFTLVELLVTIVIVGVLIALLLPAIQMVREAGRNTACKNKIRQVAMAILNIESSKEALPGKDWLYETMPFLELDFVVKAMQEKEFDSFPPQLSILSCPSDSSTKPQSIIYSNYQGNCGVWPVDGKSNGVFRLPSVSRSPVMLSSVTDGLSNTALIAECLTGSTSTDQARLRYFWGTPGTYYIESEFQEFFEVCMSIPSKPLENGWQGSATMRGGFLQLPSGLATLALINGVGVTLYNHAAPPQNPSCTNGRSYPAAIATATSNHGATVNVAFCDGHVGSFDSSIELTVWRQLGDRDGSNPY